MNESDFKRWLRTNWDGWMETYEPRRGTGIGIPDVQIVVDGRIVPIELKVGVIKNGVLFPREIRPPQIVWHKKLNDAGVASVLLIGVYDFTIDDFIACAVDGQYIRNWKHGYKHYIKFDPTDSSRFNLLFPAWCKARMII